MAFVYQQNSKFDGKFDPSRCKALVTGERVTAWQCRRKPWKDGWCKQHHPDTENARRAASQARYDAKWKRQEANEIRNAIELLRSEGYRVLPPRRGDTHKE